jgi:uncharacterized protein YPO0396
MTSAPTGYRLHTLHLYNWGAFSGRHQATIDPGNTAIIGPTGSGKTTLIDALMTLLCANPRYNLASTGGHESDRDLVSYVRGASGPGHLGDDSRHLARTGRCVTGLAAQLVRAPASDAEDSDSTDTVLIGAILWLDGSSSAQTDLNRRWFFAQGKGHSLDLWLEEHHSGGARALGRLEKNTPGLQLFSSKSAYLARLQRFFDVGPNAFTLLNRAAGLKQLNSIDEIFRELVLDDHAAYDDALNVVASFDELAAIHAELALAHSQYLALLPLRELGQQEQALQLRLRDWQHLNTALPHWFATQGQRLWGERQTQLHNALTQQQAQVEAATRTHQQAQAHAQTLLEAYLLSGGGHIEQLRQNIATLQTVLEQKHAAHQDGQTLLRNLGLHATEPTLDAAALARCQAQATPALHTLDSQHATLQHAAEDAIAQERSAHAQLQTLREEHEAVRKRPGSNLPTEFHTFRAALAEQLDVPPTELPFVAELVEVQKTQHAWRGAIERALGSHRLRILVPPEHMPAALDWVNQRHNRLHVRLLEAREPATSVSFWPDGYACKLNLKNHPLQAALRQLLHEQDRHCVADAQTLRHTPHAMTREGLMSGKAHHFDKHDQKRLDQDWLTGFDNRDRLAQLEHAIQTAEAQWHTLDQAKHTAQGAQAQAAAKRLLWEHLLRLNWSDLDTNAPQTQMQQLQQRLDALLNPQSDTAQAKARWEAAQQQAQGAGEAVRQCQEQCAVLKEKQKHAEQQQQACAARLDRVAPASPIAPADPPFDMAHLLATLLPQLDPATLTCETLADQERQTLAHASTQRDTLNRQRTELHKDLIRQMGKAQKEDRGTLTEQAQEVEALPAYLERLRVLEEEALPDKRKRFQDYLNNASDQGVSTLLNGIRTEVGHITERIAQLNHTLQRVDFQPGTCLQLEPQPVAHPVLKELEQAMAQLRSERLRDDDSGQSHYRALQTMVQLLREHANNRRTKTAQALFDPRYRLQFAVQVLDRATGQVLERRTGSQGGSGGEKEIIASYVLTASLSYALCPPGRQWPLFASIVLDEAFSKSSQAVAARIIQALREFGLHALFVTPNKELRLLRQHTRSAVLVHRRDSHATLACLSWEELDAHASHRKTMSKNGI